MIKKENKDGPGSDKRDFKGIKVKIKVFTAETPLRSTPLSGTSLRKLLCIRSVISVNYHCITVFCLFNLLIRFICYNTV